MGKQEFKDGKKLTANQVWRQFVYNVCHGPIITNIAERVTLMDQKITLWTSVFLLKMLHKAAFTN